MSEPAHRLLLVDDDEAFVEALARMFRRRGHEAVTALNGANATHALENSEAPFDAAVVEGILAADDPLPALRQALPELDFTAFGAVLAGLAVIAGIFGLMRRENWRISTGGILLGAGAIAFQFLTWAIVVIMGGMILIAIIKNVDGILGD